MPGPERYPAAKRAEAERLLRDTEMPLKTIAERTHVAYESVCRWNRFAGIRPVAYRLSAQRGFAPAIEAMRRGAVAPEALSAAIANHAAQQIAALDAKLRRKRAGGDPVRVLRDLVALARILDDLNTRNRSGRARRHDEDGEADGGGPDIAILRADLARRIEAALASGADPATACGAERSAGPGARA